MERKRKNIPAGIRWNVFQRDNFRCVYCGASRGEGATLVVDHGDPFSKGGADDESNYVTACKPCNDGKKAKIVIPPAAEIASVPGCVVRRGVAYKSHLHADWADAFRQVCYSVEYCATYEWPEAAKKIECLNGVDGEKEPDSDYLLVDFACDFLSKEVGAVNVVIAENCDPGCFRDEDRRRIRNAVILGYEEPTLIIIGSPWLYYAAVVNCRYKGNPVGLKLDEHLDAMGAFRSSGWYPDENWDFADPRDDFRLRPQCFDRRAWQMTAGEAATLAEKEARYGL